MSDQFRDSIGPGLADGVVDTSPAAGRVFTFGKRSVLSGNREVPGFGQRMVGLAPVRERLGSEFDHRSPGVAKVELIAGYERC